MDNRIRQRSRTGLVVAACLFAAIGIGVVLGAQRLIADAAQVAHTHEVIATVDALEARLRDAEANQRGYLLTGEPVFLADYRIAGAALPDIRDTLFALVGGDAAQSARARELWASVARRQGQIERTLLRYREGGLAAAQAAIGQDVIAASTAIRRRAAALRDAERALLVQRAQSTRDSATVLRLLALLGIPLGLLAIAVVYRLLVEEIRRRARAEAGTADANRQLRIGLERVERGKGELQALNRYGSLLQSCATHEEALRLAQQLLEDLLPGVGGLVYRIRNSQDHGELALAWGGDGGGHAAAQMLSVEACWALRRGQPHAAGARRGARCPHLGQATDGAGPSLCVPLVAHGTQLGLLTLEDAPGGDAVDAHRDLVQAAAEHLSMALANLSLQDRLREQSIRDPLSGLFNRRYLEESASRELTRCARRKLPLSLLMFDIDHFKAFNDLHGHPGGDALLAQFGKLLQAMSRGEDIACRYGGEEFTLILPEADLETARHRAETIRIAVQAMQVPFLGKLLPQVTVSVGAAGFPVHGETPEALLQAADEALYRAKREGRNRVVVAPG